MNLKTFVKNCTFIVDLIETVWGNMSVMTVGTFHVFTKMLTSTCVLQVNPDFLKSTQFAVSHHEQFIPLWETHMRRLLFSENEECEASSFLRIHIMFLGVGTL